MDWIAVPARLAQFGGGLVLFGAPLFFLYGYRPEGSVTGLRSWPRLTLLLAGGGALAGVFVWTVAQAAVFFPETSFFAREPLWILLTETGVGRVTGLRAGLIALAIMATLVLPPGNLIWSTLAVVGGLTVASFAWTGHGVHDAGWYGAIHTGADVLHLLAAGIWIGALVPLGVLIWKSLKSGTASAAGAALRGLERFSGIGPAAVAVLVGTGLINSWFLIGIAQWPALFTTAYGIGLMAKLGLFAAMLLLAAANRYRLCPALRRDIACGHAGASSLRQLRNSVLSESVLGFLVLLAVSVIGILAPPISN